MTSCAVCRDQRPAVVVEDSEGTRAEVCAVCWRRLEKIPGLVTVRLAAVPDPPR